MSDLIQNAQGATGALVGVSITTSTTVATGVLDSINQYAPIIGLGLSLTSITLAVAFFTLNYRRDVRRQVEELCAMKDRIREEVLSEIRLKDEG